MTGTGTTGTSTDYTVLQYVGIGCIAFLAFVCLPMGALLMKGPWTLTHGLPFPRCPVTTQLPTHEEQPIKFLQLVDLTDSLKPK
jgi:hypothetical protein